MYNLRKQIKAMIYRIQEYKEEDVQSIENLIRSINNNNHDQACRMINQYIRKLEAVNTDRDTVTRIQILFRPILYSQQQQENVKDPETEDEYQNKIKSDYNTIKMINMEKKIQSKNYYIQSGQQEKFSYKYIYLSDCFLEAQIKKILYMVNHPETVGGILFSMSKKVPNLVQIIKGWMKSYIFIQNTTNLFSITSKDYQIEDFGDQDCKIFLILNKKIRIRLKNKEDQLVAYVYGQKENTFLVEAIFIEQYKTKRQISYDQNPQNEPLKTLNEFFQTI